MLERDIEVPARYYVRLGEMLTPGRADRGELFCKARIGARALEQPDALLRHSQVERLVRLAGELSGRTDLGFELGKTLTMSAHSLVGFGMLSSPDIDSSLRFVARFFRLVMPSFSMRYARRPHGGADAYFAPVIGMSPACLAFHLEAIATSAHREIREMCGNLPQYEIRLSVPEPPHARRYADLKGVRWLFGATPHPGVHLSFDFDLREYRLAMADGNALQMAEARCRALLGAVAAEGSFSDWTAMMLREAANGLPTLGDLAAMLNLSTRTLARHLAREGNGFRALAARAKHDLACERLLGGKMGITGVAHSLGYDDAANFTRAFRAESGCSPSEFLRRAAQAGPAARRRRTRSQRQ